MGKISPVSSKYIVNASIDIDGVVFNGFASKGMLWAPYYAADFAKEIINN